MKLLEITTMMDIKEHKTKLFDSMVYAFFDKKTGLGISINKELAKEVHKPVTKKLKRRKVYPRFKENIWAADLAEMESSPSKNKNI